MKTAISLPDRLFEAAEQFAREQKLSRSELYAQALQFYLHTHRYHGVTETLNQLYTEEPGTLHPAFAPVQAHTVPQEEW